MGKSDISIAWIIRHYPGTMMVTWGLILLEAGLIVSFPLLIGAAIDDLGQMKLTGLAALTGLCVTVLAAGAGRRFFDTRAYARLYQDLAKSIHIKNMKAATTLSRTSARIGMLDEVIAYFEQDLPAFIDSLVSFTGILVILWVVNLPLAITACLSTTAILLIYVLAERPIRRLNRGQNIELERQLGALASNRETSAADHFRRLSKWRIRLSDLETVNYSSVWLILTLLIIAGLWVIGRDRDMTDGEKLAAIMYIFQYIEGVMAFPLLYQQFLRISEITQRLSPTKIISTPK
ncbi:ABC transporter six-transmembrane domain-containing protein [Aestuariispira insulae]|uniref:ABC transporter transmembrane protein n=1 Tax=Aestuariispira insulae TaxID=1461337 RepID=A0A3D9HP81_9PROT|nr:ABC transporter six-transmembrane domain-containing protein [Aestuariispira insulae]RED51314.1 ABC transporter transmembrane protein [Aestuariispira insulae]